MGAVIDPRRVERASKVLERAGFTVEKAEDSKSGAITIKIKAPE